MSPKRRAPKAILDGMDALASRRYRESHAMTLVDMYSKSLKGSVSDDYLIVTRFLNSYDGSSATFNAYRRELERLLQWAWLVHKQSVLTLNRDDIVEFIKFVTKPPVAWIGTKNVPRFITRNADRIPNPVWRPFVVRVTKSKFKQGKAPDKTDYAPSHASIRSMFGILSSFYDFLVQESYVAANPVALIRQKSKFLKKDQNRSIVRRISDLQWDYVLETAELMADDNPAIHERTLFVMTALFSMYLRISELVADERSSPTMDDFRKDCDNNWWFHVTGKGNKDRTVAVSNAMLRALKRYRRSLELSELPPKKDPAPLIIKTRGKGPISSTRHIRRIVQDCFDRAFDRMKKDGLADDALDLKEATVHWLRHTGISEDVQNRPREHVRDDAGHASMATTDRYIESDERERHATSKEKVVKFFE